MSQQAIEIERAASVGLTAGNVDRTTHYTHPEAASRQKLLEQASDVLLLILSCSLSETAGLAFLALFEHRLHRAYEGQILPQVQSLNFSADCTALGGDMRHE